MNLIHYVNQCWLFQVSWMEIMIKERVKRRWRSKVATNSVQWLILKPRTSYVPPYSRKKSAVLARNANSPMISKNSWKANQKTLDHTVSCLRPTGNVRLDWPVDMAASTYRRTSKILSIKNFMMKNLRWAAKRCLVIPPFFQEQGGSKLGLLDWNTRMIWWKELWLWTWVEGVLGSWYLFILRSIFFLNKAN